MSSELLPPLVAEYRAKTDDFHSGSDKVKSKVKEVEQQTSQSTSSMGSAWSSVTGMLGPLGTGIGVVAAGLGALTTAAIAVGDKSLHAFADFGTAVGGVQRIMGSTAQEASGLVVVGQEMGVSTDSLARSMKFLSKNLGEAGLDTKTAATHSKALETAQDGLRAAQQKVLDTQARQHESGKITVNSNIQLRDATEAVTKAQQKLNEVQGTNTVESGKAAAAASELGISIKDNNGNLRDQMEVMADVADKFQAMEDGPEKTRLAMDLFGKSGTDMIGMLNQGGDALRDTTAEAKRLGLELDDNGVASAKATGRAFRDLGIDWKAIQIQIGQELAPAFQTVAYWMHDNLPSAIETAKTWLKEHEQDFKNVGKSIMDAMVWARDNVPGILGTIKDAIETVNGKLSDAHDWWVKNIGDGNDFKNGLDRVRGIIDPIAGSIQNLIDKLSTLNDKMVALQGGQKGNDGKTAGGGATFNVTDFANPVMFFNKWFEVANQSIHGKATGGPMAANRPYLVGEQGPELFTPNQSGNLSTAKQTAAGGTGGGNVYNINVTALSRAAAVEYADIIAEELRRRDVGAA